jgi:hypothetical protein
MPMAILKTFCVTGGEEDVVVEVVEVEVVDVEVVVEDVGVAEVVAVGRLGQRRLLRQPQQLLLTYLMGTELEFVIMVIAVSCVKLLSAHNSTQHTSRKHKV